MKGAEKTVILMVVFLMYHGRILRKLKYAGVFSMNDVPEEERKAVARQIADKIIATLKQDKRLEGAVHGTAYSRVQTQLAERESHWLPPADAAQSRPMSHRLAISLASTSLIHVNACISWIHHFAICNEKGANVMQPKHHRPEDDLEPGTPGTGEDVCPDCKGTGRQVDEATGKQSDKTCERCDGTGIIIEAIG